MTARFKDHILGPDTHANRPAASGMPEAAIYECTTHGLIYKNVSGSWVTYGTLVPPGGTTGQALVKNSATDGDVGWGAGGGGGGSTIKDPRWTAQTGETSVDEFNDASLDAAWVRVDGTGAASGNITWTEGGDVLSAYNVGGDTTDKFHALLRPLTGAGGSMTAGDAFITCADLFAPISTNYSFCGLVLSTGATFGSGEQVWAEFGTSVSGQSQMQVFGWSGFGTAGTAAGALPGTLPIQKIYIRLVMTAANTWRADFSHDGVSWWKGTATLSKTMTPTHVGFFDSSYGSSTKHIVSYEFLRRVSGVS